MGVGIGSFVIETTYSTYMQQDHDNAPTFPSGRPSNEYLIAANRALAVFFGFA